MNEQILERIAVALEKLAGTNEELGVFPEEIINTTTRIYSGGGGDIQQGVPWYELGENDTHISYAGKVIKGRLMKVEVVEKTDSFNNVKEKLEVTLESMKDGAPHTYVIVSGFESNLSTSFLQRINAINGLKQGAIIGIRAKAGDRAIMCDVYDSTNQRVWCDWEKDCNRRALLNSVRQKLGLEVRQSPPSPPSPNTPVLDHGLLLNEVISLQRRKNISNQKISSWCQTRFNNPELKQLTAPQLLQMKMGLVDYNPQSAK